MRMIFGVMQHFINWEFFMHKERARHGDGEVCCIDKELERILEC